MKIKKVISEALNEATIDYTPEYTGSIYADNAKLEKIRDRKVDIARTIEMAKYARAKAVKANDQAAVDQLDALIAQLQEWYNSADKAEKEIMANQSSDTGDESHDSSNAAPEADSDKPGDDEKDKEDEDAKDDKKSGEEDNSNKEPAIDTDGVDRVDDDRPTGQQNGGDSDSMNGDSDSDSNSTDGGDKDDTDSEDDSDSDDVTNNGTKGDGEDEKDSDDTSKGNGDGDEEESDDDIENDDDGSADKGKKSKSKKSKGKGGDGEDSEDTDDEGSGDGEEDDSEEDGDGDVEDEEDGDSDGDGEEEGEEEDDGTSSAPGMPKVKDDKILVDPFSRKISGQQQLPDFMEQALNDGKLQIEDEWEAFKRIVAKLKGESREGAKKAIIEYMKAKYGVDLTEAFNNMGESLLEAIMNLKLHEEWTKPGDIDEIDDEEFGAGIRSAIEEIKRIKPELPIEIEPDSQIDMGFNEISQDDGSDLDTEDATNKQDAKSTAEAEEDEINKYSTSVGGLAGMETFKDRILRAMADQVALQDDDEETYAVLNRRNEEDPMVLLKGTREDPKWEERPNIEVYCDCSYSWNDHDLERAFRALAVLNTLVQEEKIFVKVLYFSEHVHSAKYLARAEGSTTAWNEIQSNIVAHNTKNVVLITDDDMDGQAMNSNPIYVQGCVWFLWKKTRCQYIVEKIRGRSGVYEFDLYK